MKITYSLNTNAAISCSTIPASIQVDAVDIEWTIVGSELTGADLVMRNLVIQPDPATGVIMVRDPGRDMVAFRVASFIADTVYALSGIDGFNPQQVFTRAPVIEAETPPEAVVLNQTMKRNAVMLPTTAAIARQLNGGRLAGGQPIAVAIAHYARAMRATDPFEEFQELYKVVESLAPRQLDGAKLDQWVSGQAVAVAPTFTEQRVEQLRHLRTRMTHPQARLGHLDPHDLQHIQEARANLPDMDQLARILIWGTPTPWV